MRFFMALVIFGCCAGYSQETEAPDAEVTIVDDGSLPTTSPSSKEEAPPKGSGSGCGCGKPKVM